MLCAVLFMLYMLEVLEVMRCCAVLYAGGRGGRSLSVGATGGGALSARDHALYAGGSGERALCVGDARGHVLCAARSVCWRPWKASAACWSCWRLCSKCPKCLKCWSLKGALCAALHVGSRGERALFAEGAGGVSICFKVVERVCYVPKLLEGMRCVLWVPEVVFYVLELLEPEGVALCAALHAVST